VDLLRQKASAFAPGPQDYGGQVGGAGCDPSSGPRALIAKGHSQVFSYVFLAVTEHGDNLRTTRGAAEKREL
jgi:hypothetical protein